MLGRSQVLVCRASGAGRRPVLYGPPRVSPQAPIHQGALVALLKAMPECTDRDEEASDGESPSGI
jgi:hypothetical protein